jgi:hypothetical protein
MFKLIQATQWTKAQWRRRRWWWGLLPLVGVIGLTFQNCGMDTQFKSAPADHLTQASLSEETLPDSHVEVTGEIKPTSYDMVLADRYYLQSLFTNIFGPSAEAADSTKLFLNAVEFGSPCDLYESYLDRDHKSLVNAMENCITISATRVNARMMPLPTVARQGLLTRACSDLVQNPATMAHALARIGTGIPDSSDANVKRLYRLFYRLQSPPTAGVVDSLQLILNYGGHPTVNNWRSAFFTVCASSYWQAL